MIKFAVDIDAAFSAVRLRQLGIPLVTYSDTFSEYFSPLLAIGEAVPPGELCTAVHYTFRTHGNQDALTEDSPIADEITHEEERVILQGWEKIRSEIADKSTDRDRRQILEAFKLPCFEDTPELFRRVKDANGEEHLVILSGIVKKASFLVSAPRMSLSLPPVTAALKAKISASPVDSDDPISSEVGQTNVIDSPKPPRNREQRPMATGGAKAPIAGGKHDKYSSYKAWVAVLGGVALICFCIWLLVRDPGDSRVREGLSAGTAQPATGSQTSPSASGPSDRPVDNTVAGAPGEGGPSGGGAAPKDSQTSPSASGPATQPSVPLFNVDPSAVFEWRVIGTPEVEVPTVWRGSSPPPPRFRFTGLKKNKYKLTIRNRNNQSILVDQEIEWVYDPE